MTSRVRIGIACLVVLLVTGAGIVLFVAPGYLVAGPGSRQPPDGSPARVASPVACPADDGVLGPAHCTNVTVVPGLLVHCGGGPVSSYLFENDSFAFYRYIPCFPSPLGTNVNVTVSVANGTVFEFELTEGAPAVWWVNWTSPDESVAVDWFATTWNFTLIVGTGGYPVTFTEAGLPAGTNWSLTLNGSLAWSHSDSILFILPDGTYGFTVAATGYTEVSSPSSPLSVSGTAVGVMITFAPDSSPKAGNRTPTDPFGHLLESLENRG